jgi:type II secretory pathway pseudopilin PulG
MKLKFDAIKDTALYPAMQRGRLSAFGRAFTLMETLVAILVVGMLVMALVSGMTVAVHTVQFAREEQMATQIMAEKLDTIRLYSWDKIITLGYVPASFQAPIYPGAEGAVVVDTNPSSYFNGKVTIANSGMSESYRDDVRLVTITMSWQTAGVSRIRSMSTYVARYGLQTFVY